MPIASDYSYTNFIVDGEGLLPVVENAVFTYYQETQATFVNLLYKAGYYGCFFPCKPGDIITVINGGCPTELVQQGGHNQRINSVFFVDPRLQTYISDDNYAGCFKNKEIVIPTGAGYCGVNSSHGHLKVFKGKFLHATVNMSILSTYAKNMNDLYSMIPDILETFTA